MHVCLTGPRCRSERNKLSSRGISQSTESERQPKVSCTFLLQRRTDRGAACHGILATSAKLPTPCAVAKQLPSSEPMTHSTAEWEASEDCSSRRGVC